MKKRVIIMQDGAKITEKLTKVQSIQVYGYYYKGAFIFGAEQTWTEESLRQLYNTGYFDI